jgi:thiol-disulfide isomerase/thioredoxin
MHAAAFQDGLVVFAKRACPTCTLIEPVLRELARSVPAFRVVSQDDPRFPEGVPAVVDDRELEHSFRNGIETTPTLIRFEGGREVERAEGWDAAEWRRITGIARLGEGLPPHRPG